MALNPDDAAQAMLDSVLDALTRGGTAPVAQKLVLDRMAELIASGRGAMRKAVGPLMPKIQIKAYGTVVNP